MSWQTVWSSVLLFTFIIFCKSYLILFVFISYVSFDSIWRTWLPLEISWTNWLSEEDKTFFQHESFRFAERLIRCNLYENSTYDLKSKRLFSFLWSCFISIFVNTKLFSWSVHNLLRGKVLERCYTTGVRIKMLANSIHSRQWHTFPLKISR